MSGEPWPNARYYQWKWMERNDVPLPEPGTSCYMSEWRECSQEDADVVEVPYTCWGDYVGSTVQRSNHDALLEDYPGTFIEVTGDYYWSHALYVVPGMLMEDDGGTSLLDDIRKLYDYPLYNEEHHSMLETEIAWEMWDNYLQSDVNMALLEGDIDTDTFTDDDWTFTCGRYYSLTYECDNGPECEDAVSAYFPDHDAVMAELVAELNTLGLEHDPRRPNPNQLTMITEV